MTRLGSHADFDALANRLHGRGMSALKNDDWPLLVIALEEAVDLRRPRPQIFVDMDGVLADFDAHHEAVFGFRSCKLADNVDWNAVRAVPSFYEAIPPMADMAELWGAVESYKPIVLTGVPRSVEEAPDNKRAWVRKHIGPDVEVRCCRSAEKCLHAHPGDILIDDWNKYQHLWEQAGGIFILHTSAAASVTELKRVLEASA